MEKIKHRSNTYHRAYGEDVLRALSDEELADLEASVRKYGILQPVTVNAQRHVIDGWHRLQLAAKLDIDCPMQQRELSDEEERQLALDINLSRRHLGLHELTEMRRARIERVAAARAKGDSLRTIAETEKVSQTQVRNDLDTATAQGGCAVEPPEGRVMGKDGKSRPAVKPNPPPAPALSIFCERCQRTGPTTGCERCADLRREASGPGERYTTNGTPAKPSKPPKNGAMEGYDWAAFDRALGVVMRLPDDMKRAYQGEQRTTEYHGAGRLLDQIAPLMEQLVKLRKLWQKRIDKAHKEKAS